MRGKCEWRDCEQQLIVYLLQNINLLVGICGVRSSATKCPCVLAVLWGPVISVL